jgi:hypothetical protein
MYQTLLPWLNSFGITCVCLPVTPYETTWLPVERVHEIFFSGFLLISVEKIQFCLQLDKIKRQFTWKHIFVTHFVSNITNVTDISVVALFTLVLWLQWWMLPLIFLLPWLLWLPRLVMFLSCAIIMVTKQHILELYILFSPHGQILTKILVSIS